MKQGLNNLTTVRGWGRDVDKACGDGGRGVEKRRGGDREKV